MRTYPQNRRQTHMSKVLGLTLATLLLGPLVTVQADDPQGFSEPANMMPPPAWAVGQANRAADLDVLPGFQKPPPGFGVVPFFWWLGDPLTKDRLGWILEQMSGLGISGYQINYAHSDKGGRSWGLTYPSDPPLFSKEWWNLVGWFMGEAKKQGAAVSLSDYTLGFGQGWCVDEILSEHPEVLGMNLRMGKDGKVTAEKVPISLNPLHPMSGKWYADKFFGQFERHFPGEGGKGLNFFFSDELGFGVGGHLWSERFAEEFKKRKGYEITPELPALFKDIGPRTPKVRLDYSDVMVALSEENFFKPLFDWHQQRGMTMGCDHGGRGQNVVEFGDYFRTQRWNQGPGADQPGLGKNLIKSKVAASIAHLYQQPRVWLEGYYGSGWGTTTAGLVDATFADFTMGYNLLSLHGMYYATHGGFWEWAPPDNTFRMPYWKHIRPFMDCVQRLSYLLTQGHHRCDVAILYPVAPMEAGMDGPLAVKTAFATAQQLYGKSVDFDFMDFQSLARAKVVGKELHVAGEVYRVLVLPAMKAVRHSTLTRALEFHRAGGIVVALGALPEASDRVGRDDPEVAAMVKEMFPAGPANDIFAKLPSRDYDGPGYIQHRKLGPRDLYVVYDAPKDTECFFRATGKVELWDPWTGAIRPLAVNAQTAEGTRLKLPLSQKEIQLIVFSPGKATIAGGTSGDQPSATIPVEGPWELELKPSCDNRFGDFHWPPTPTLVGAEARQFRYADEVSTNPGWEVPTFDDSKWPRVTNSFGPKFWKLGPLPPSADLDAKLAALDTVDPTVPIELGGKKYRWQPYEFSWRWGVQGDPGHQGYHGLMENVTDWFICLGARRPGRNQFVYGPENEGTRYYLWTSVVADRDGRVHPLSAGNRPAAIWVNHGKVSDPTMEVKRGTNPLLLRYDRPGRGYFVVSTEIRPESEADVERPASQPAPLAMRWFGDKAILPFDVRPQIAQPAGWYRFRAAPGLQGLTVPAAGDTQAWVNGKAVPGKRLATGWRFELNEPVKEAPIVALRIEQPRGYYGGAGITEPISQDCGKGTIEPGDWSKIDGLTCYSGGAWYRKTLTLSAKQAQGPVNLDLGKAVSSAEVHVNGKLAGIRLAPPWWFDISGQVKAGENRIEVLIYNTLANHYVTIPTRYRGDLTSGLLGPVTIETKVP